MRRKSDTPSRSEVTETIEKHKSDMSEKTDKLDIIASDKETVVDTQNHLDFGGTQEGSDAVETILGEAEDVTVEIFSQENEGLEEIQTDADEYRDGLQENSDSVESDLGKISDAGGQIETKETVDKLKDAETSVSEDRDFLKEQMDRAKEARDENKQLQEVLKGRVASKGR